MAEAAAAGCEVVEYSPNQVKQAVTGVGGASKDQMERMVQTLLGIDRPLRPVDAADAVALALCHLPTRRCAGAVRPGGGPVIGSLRGTLLDRGDAEVTVEVGGVGYRVRVSPTTAVSLGEVGQEVFCWVHHHQREDAAPSTASPPRTSALCFEALLGAHGVGPALALAILSIHAPVALARILAEDDLGALCLVPGVGKKTAARLLLDLKSRLSIPDLGERRSRWHGPAGDGPAAPAPTCARRWPAWATPTARCAR